MWIFLKRKVFNPYHNPNPSIKPNPKKTAKNVPEGIHNNSFNGKIMIVFTIDKSERLIYLNYNGKIG